MTPERWQLVDSLLQKALECPPDQQSAFLDEACAGDITLKQDIESLLQFRQSAESFIESPALEAAAQLLTDDRAELIEGHHLGPYKVIRKIGEGGMSEVYLAQDARLGRRVALKLLRGYFTRDKDRLRRFQMEARAASALNHPNILTIYEVGEADGLHFIATEFIDGLTLRSIIKKYNLNLVQSLDVAIQVAGAMKVAHGAGIIHRDIKPENIMIRPDGYAKVLDFGLAKLVEPGVPPEEKSEDFSRIDTLPGMVLGTASYMSPEQARGQAVDARTDVFSLGVVLYEMITGRLPFEGETTVSIIASILEREPLPITLFSTEAPERLQQIISKSLAKRRGARYQTTKDMLIDLKSLKREFEPGAAVTQSNLAALDYEATTEPKSRQTSAHTVGGYTSSIKRVAPRIAGVAKNLVHSAKPKRKIITLALALLALVAASLGTARLLSVRRAEPIDSIAVLPFTNTLGNRDSEIISDGITESVISRLAQLPRLKVIASATVFKYKGRNVDLIETGQALNVKAVLTGSVVLQSDLLVIASELVNIADGTRLWGGNYRRKLSDIFAVQTEIAEQISENLRMQLTSEQKQRLGKHYTKNGHAYLDYLNGRYQLSNDLTQAGVGKAMDAFKDAIKKDPDYALAYAGLADSYYSLSNLYLPPKEAMYHARMLTKKALEIDDTLGEVHTSLALIKAQYEWDWAEAETEYLRAIALNPSFATAHHGYGIFLLAMGRFDEAMTELRQAQMLDPLSASIGVTAICPLLYSRRYDEAIEQVNRFIEREEGFFPAFVVLGWAYAGEGQYHKALAAFERMNPLDPPASVKADLGCIYARLNNVRDAQKILDELIKLSKNQYISPVSVAKVHIALGATDQAIAWLEKAYRMRDEELILIKVAPWFDPLRADPRFTNLLNRMNLSS